MHMRGSYRPHLLQGSVDVATEKFMVSAAVDHCFGEDLISPGHAATQDIDVAGQHYHVRMDAGHLKAAEFVMKI
ncbi:hypothetical protein AL060_12175 [Pseudomonas syringae pv. rhaphiolepidis]|nr:hypothetical protein AL060_12175 [Pseudomonas syringae pv. rhaphiolepidis]